MKNALIAIAVLGAIVGSAFLGVSIGVRAVKTPKSMESQPAMADAARPVAVAAPEVPVSGPHFEDNDAACVHNYDATHLAKLMRDHDATAYIAYANEKRCQWIKKGTPIYVESGMLDDGVIEIRLKGSTESLYTQSASITVFSDGGSADDRQYDDAPVIKAEIESMHAAERANVRGTINHPVQACDSHGGECITLQPGTQVILDVPSTNETDAWFEIVNPSGDQPHALVSASSSAITLN